MKTLLSITFCCFLFVSLSAQQQLLIQGKIVDQSTQEPIGYAHIGLPASGIGTTSSNDGIFKLSIPINQKDEWFTVSFMGYKTFKKRVKDLEEFTTILLEKDNIHLTEIIVMEETKVEDYIYRAVRNIPQNYPTYPTTSRGFYRESEADDSLNYRYMAEGILNIYKKGYDTGKDGQVSLVQGRRLNLENPLDTNIYSGLGAGHFAAHRFDIVQNRESFLKKKNFPKYKYWMERITSYNSRPVYIIGFGPDEEGSSANSTGRMQGRVYIEKETYAILRAEFEITPEAIKKMNGQPLYFGAWTTNKYVINYRSIGNQWYFSDALREGTQPNGSRYTNEILITDINLERSKPVPYLDRLQKDERFTLSTGSYDVDFWKDYNTSPLSGKLAESVRQLENAKKAQAAFDHAYMLELQRQRDSMQLAKATAIQEGDTSLNLEKLQRMQQLFVPPDYSRVRSNFGLGVQRISSHLDQLTITYFLQEDMQEPILQLDDDISARELDALFEWSVDIFLKKYFYTTIGGYGSFLNGINSNFHLGVGTAINISKQRPVFVKLDAGYSTGKYARRIGITENNFGTFKVKNKKFNSEEIKLFYGSRVHRIQASSTLAIELTPHRELYVRGTAHIPFANTPFVRFKEKGQFFNKDNNLSLDDEALQVLSNGLPFNDAFFNGPVFSISIGVSFK